MRSRRAMRQAILDGKLVSKQRSLDIGKAPEPNCCLLSASAICVGLALTFAFCGWRAAAKPPAVVPKPKPDAVAQTRACVCSNVGLKTLRCLVSSLQR